MPRPCLSCRHSDLDEINRRLVAGTESNRNIGADFGLSAGSIDRHRRFHLGRRLARAEAAREETEARTLGELVVEYRGHALRILAKAEASGDWRAAISALRELIRLAELWARASGELRSGGSSHDVTVNVLQAHAPRSDAEAEREARLVLQVIEDERQDRLLASAAAAPEGSAGL